MGNAWPFSYIFPILKMRSNKNVATRGEGVENTVMSPSPRFQICLRVWSTNREFVQNSQKSQAETLAVLDDKLEDVHLSAFQPCGKAWQAAITCTLVGKRWSAFTRWWFQTVFFNFHPDPWGNDPIWLLFSYMGWNHQLLEYIMKCWV